MSNRSKIIIGSKYGSMTVIKKLDHRTKQGNAIYELKCDCGNVCEKSTSAFTYKKRPAKYCSYKCPLNIKENKHAIKHGLSKSYEYKLLQGAKQRAQKQNVPFSLTIDDIVIPQKCPFLNIDLKKSKGRFSDSSPSLDKIIPSLGYVKGNVQVISHKANVMKNGASLEELKIFSENILIFLKESYDIRNSKNA